jgi:hypothetical protein
VFFRLINLGLIQVAVDPKHPDQMMLDTRVLESYLSRFGPRVTTSTGELAVSASRTEIWTPQSGGGQPPVWTPPSAAPVPKGQGKSPIIITGR